MSASGEGVPPVTVDASASVRSPRFPAIEGIRALAALAIVAYHVGELGQTQGQLAIFGQRLTLGVPVFFVVSAFVLYRPFVAARVAEKPTPAIGAFLIRRATRIVPLYWITLTVVWFTSPLLSSQSRDQFFNGIPWWRYYLFTQIYDEASSIWALGPAWSLNVEFAFYLVLPLWALAAAWLVRRKVPVQVELVLLVCIFLGATALLESYLSTGSYLSRTPAPNAGYFAIGMALAIVSVDLESTRPRLLSRAVRFVAPAAPIAIAAILAAFLLVTVLPQFWLFRMTLVTLVLLPAVFDRRTSTLTKSILMQRHLQLVGVLSYAVYLFHRQIALGLRLYFWAPMGRYDFVVAFAAVLALTMVLAKASYRYLEKPLIHMARTARRPAKPGQH